MRNGLSRRDMLSMAGTAGGLAVASRFGHAFAAAQGGAQRIEQMDAALGNIIATNEPIRQLATGYGGDIGPAEMTAWMGTLNSLRLVLGTKLDVDEELPTLAADDPLAPAYAVYEYLGWRPEPERRSASWPPYPTEMRYSRLIVQSVR